jgi:hypothetical protein
LAGAGASRMRRSKAFKRGRMISLLLAGMIGYAVGDRHSSMPDSDPSAAESVARRFPQQWNTASPTSGAADVSIEPAAMATANKDAQLALFSPEPMVPQVSIEAARQAAQDASPERGTPIAAAEDAGPPPAPDTGESTQAPPPVAAGRPPAATRVPVLAVRHPAPSRPGYMLDDAQIASIRERLHLTPDQERMWPAVEAALRNIAYARVQAAHRRGAPAGGAQVAAVDPNAVEGLKSAAVPLIMSFNDEQKEEVRGLVHVMGLDQLAREF